MQLKICGLKYADNIAELEKVQPDMMGFIFYKASPRYVGEGFVMPQLNSTIKKVGVFVNEESNRIKEIITQYNLDYVQLHGDEDETYCKQLRSFVKIIKAFRITEQFNFSQLSNYVDKADLFIFDSPGKGYGGNGTVFSWQLLEKYQLQLPFLLSGGINLNEIKNVIEAKRKFPQMLGADVNSGFEISPGLKNTNELQKFKNAIS